MTSRDPVSRFLATLRARPRVALATGATAIAAVVAGGVLAMALGQRGVAQAPSATTTATPSPVATPSESASLSASPSATPSVAPTASATAVPTEVASPSPEPTAVTTPESDPNWAALPPMPDAESWSVADALMLEDGRLVIFRTPYMARGAYAVVTIAAGEGEWTVEALDTSIVDDITQHWAQGSDGRIYSHQWVIDPTTTPWRVEPFAIEGEQVDSYVASGPDGMLYFTTPHPMGHLVAVDPATGGTHATSPNTLITHAFNLLAWQDRIFVTSLTEIAVYDPSDDTWADVATFDSWQGAHRGDFSPDGFFYSLDADEYGAPVRLKATDPVSGAFADVPRPEDAERKWNPIFITGPDGRLWAVDRVHSYIYVGPNPFDPVP